jgi:DNA repair photolyase
LLGELSSIIEAKRRLAAELETRLTKSEIREARRDYHARRPPRHCGMTIHPAVGCSLRCIYCYIEDMGFGWTPKPYPLTGEQLVYALLVNPSFIPGRDGTLIAVGSITEPFQPTVKEKTFEYMQAISEWLGNPIQFSTKMTLTRKDVDRLKRIDPGISPLITIVSLKYYARLEPYAPKPSERLGTIRILRQAGLKPILFYRPIIPGIAEEEYEELLEEAKEHGAIGVVAGGLRVTPLILSRLKTAGIPVEEIESRIKRKLEPKVQVPVDTRDIKQMILAYAGRIDLKAFPEACMANLYTHGFSCHPMRHRGLDGDVKPPPVLKAEEIEDDLRRNRVTYSMLKIDQHSSRIIVRLTGKWRRMRSLVNEYLRCKYRTCVHVT